MFCHSLDKLGWSYSTVKSTANFAHIEVSNTKWSYQMDGSYRQTSHSPFCERCQEQLLRECLQLWHPLLGNVWARTATPQVPNSEWQPGPQRHRSLTVHDNLSYVCSLRLFDRCVGSHDCSVCVFFHIVMNTWNYHTYMFELKQVYDQQGLFKRSHASCYNHGYMNQTTTTQPVFFSVACKMLSTSTVHAKTCPTYIRSVLPFTQPVFLPCADNNSQSLCSQ